MPQFRYLILSIVLTIIGFGIWIYMEDREQIMAALSQIGLQGLLFVCALSLINYGLRFIRWHLLLCELDDRIPLWDGLICYISGFALTTTPGKAGEAIKCLFLKNRHNVHHPHTLAAILSERTSDALASSIIAIGALYAFEDYSFMVYVFLATILFIIFLINKPAALIKFCELFKFIQINIIQRIIDAIPLFMERSATLLSLKPLGQGTVIGLVSWSAEAYGFAWLAHTLGGTEPTLLYMSIFCVGMIAGAVSFLPGGLGGAEVVMYFLLVATGLGEAEALTVTLICRLATLWFAVLLGLLALLWLQYKPVTNSGVKSQ